MIIIGEMNMRSSVFRFFCIIAMTALLLSYLPSSSEGEVEVPYQKISGMVIEFNGTRAAGEPVPGAEVYIEQEPSDEPMAFTNETKTNSEGYFEVWQTAGDHRITIKANGYRKYVKVIEVTEGEDLSLDIQMEPGEDKYDVELEPAEVSLKIGPGGSKVITLKVKNTGSTVDSYNVSVMGDDISWMSMGNTRSMANGGPYSQSVSNMEDNGVADVDINISVPEDTVYGNYTFTLSARSYWDQQVAFETPLTIEVKSVEEEQEPQEEEEEDDDNPIPFIGLASIVFTSLLFGAMKRKRNR